MDIRIIIAVFLLGVIAGYISLLLILVIASSRIHHRKQPLTKEEWKLGLRQ